MSTVHPYLQQLTKAIEAEEKEELKRYRLDQQHTLKALKTEGLALHPIQVTGRNFGYADYPEIGFRLAYPADTGRFRDGAAIECFTSGEEPVKAVLTSLNGRTGTVRLFAPDFPDWIEDKDVGIKLAPDQRTTTIMKTVLKNLESNKPLFGFFRQLHGEEPVAGTAADESSGNLVYHNQRLNTSQQQAVRAIAQHAPITIVHGPPGTGKTTTLVEAIGQLVAQGEKVLVAAPSNTAVDNIAKGLLSRNLKLLRVGNASKVDEAIFPHTPEGALARNKEQQKEVRELKIRAEQFRKMALKYKRSFGKAEREQRNLLFREVKNIRTEIQQLLTYNEEKLYQEADVILGTPIGLYDEGLHKIRFQTLVMDEAGQCIEPLAWCIFPLAEKYVLAGDHLQLPPTVLSEEAVRLGLSVSILEVAVRAVKNTLLLNVQYRMREAIAGFSSAYFYGGRLLTAPYLANQGTHITFIDTAGSGFQETQGAGGSSLQNEGELKLAARLLEAIPLDPRRTAFISPYAGQADAARERLPGHLRISTIDSFQGQEQDAVIISLVRSNDEGTIGFLKDYRRMNVAITRAREQLFVIGDSATIGADAFYGAFLHYVETNGAYRTVWEFELL